MVNLELLRYVFSYISAIDGFMEVIKITQDDQNLQTYLKNQMKYLLDRVS